MNVNTLIRFALIIVGSFLIGTSNSYCQRAQLDSLGSYIEFGSGGGFTGLKHGYLLTEQGLLFSTQHTTTNDLTIIYIKKIKRSQVQSLFRSVQKIALSKLIFNEPGNTYSYIYYITDYLSYKYTWGNPDKPAPKKLIKLSHKLEKSTTL